MMARIGQWISVLLAVLAGLAVMRRRAKKDGQREEKQRQREVDWNESRKVEDAARRANRRTAGDTDDGVLDRLRSSGGLRGDDSHDVDG